MSLWKYNLRQSNRRITSGSLFQTTAKSNYPSRDAMAPDHQNTELVSDSDCYNRLHVLRYCFVNARFKPLKPRTSVLSYSTAESTWDGRPRRRPARRHHRMDRETNSRVYSHGYGQEPMENNAAWIQGSLTSEDGSRQGKARQGKERPVL